MQASPQDPINIIGQVMMESYYTVFDKREHRIGFAPLAGCPGDRPQCAAPTYDANVSPPPAASSAAPLVAHPTVESSALACSSYTDCGSCAAAPMSQGSYCGWCNGRCQRGNPEGGCAGPWAWLPEQCACSTYTTCNTCTTDAGQLSLLDDCGWCAGKCVTGNPTNNAACGQDRAWLSTECAA